MEFPQAKINIGLNVVARRPDGYHDLETIFYPTLLTDTLEAEPLLLSTAPYELHTSGYEIAGEAKDNLVVRVAVDICKEFDLPAQEIWLGKRIPMGAGLGGGSSDAAAMLRLLNETYDLQLTEAEMEQRIARYGADCAFFIQARPCYATGIGDQLQPISLSLRGLTLLLVKPSTAVSTREAYGGITPRPSTIDLREAVKRPVEEWRDVVKNDFEPGVFRLHPEIAAIKQTLYDMGALYAAMSGSGSTVFGLFRHEQESAAEVFKDCFVFQQKIR